MTVKQLIVGSLLGASALAAFFHRMPKTSPSLALKPLAKQGEGNLGLGRRSHRKQASEDRFTFNKLG